MIPFLSTLAEHYIIVLFLLANLAVSFLAHTKNKVNSFEDYAVASRSLPTGVLMMTLLATMITVGSLKQAGFIYTYGVVETFNQMCLIMQLFLVGTFIIPCLVHFTSCITLGDMVAALYGRIAQLLAGVLSCIFCLFVMGTQLNAIGAITHSFLKIDPSTAIIGFGSMVMLYSASGGIRAVSFTDVLQAIALLIVFSWITQAIIQRVGGLQVVIEKLPEDKTTFFSNPNFVYLVKGSIVWGLYPLSTLSPPIIQRMLITQDKRTLRKVWYANAFLCAFIVFMSILIGLSAIVGMKQLKLSGGEKTGLLLDLIPRLFKKKWMVDCIFLGFLAVLFSTMDSYLHAMGISFVQDVLDPLSILFGRKSLTSKEKTRYAKGSITLIGALTILLSLVGNNPFKTHGFYEYALLMSVMLIVPLIIGIVGIKTDKPSLIAFCTVYLASIIGFNKWKWELRDYFYIAVLFGTLAYFFVHIYRNRGILILKRSKLTVAEQLWLPSWSRFIQKMTSWIKAPLHLPTLASRKIVNNPTHSLSFSMLIFALYTFSSVLTRGGNDLGIANFMAGVHVVGITLCAGLMLEGIWPTRIKPYFSLYWFFTLFYCLAFGSTLAFLRVHDNTIEVAKWLMGFILLAFLVDSVSFLTLSCLGSGLAMGLWYAVFRSIPSDLLDSIGLQGLLLLSSLLVGVLLFKSSREQYISQRFNWNRTASSALGHDLRLAVGMLGGTGRALNNAFKVSESMTNTKGEKGYWIPESQATFLENFSEKMIESGEMAGKEIQDFSDFIKSQVVGIFEQKKCNMHAAAEEAIHKIKDKTPSTFKMTISGGKNFSPKVLSGIFKNVFYNLLWNAATHGKASKVDITIDEVKRTVTVQDNGKGIPSDVLPHIFDLNFSTEMKQSKNSGVGLAFVKMVVLASSGKISCHSRHGDKSSFTEFVMEFSEF